MNTISPNSQPHIGLFSQCSNPFCPPGNSSIRQDGGFKFFRQGEQNKELNQNCNVAVETTGRCHLPEKPKPEGQHPIYMKVQPRPKQGAMHMCTGLRRQGYKSLAVEMESVPTSRPSSGPFYGCCKSTWSHLPPDTPGFPKVFFHGLKCQLRPRPETLPGVYDTSGVSLKESPIPYGQIILSLKSSGTSFSFRR